MGSGGVHRKSKLKPAFPCVACVRACVRAFVSAMGSILASLRNALRTAALPAPPPVPPPVPWYVLEGAPGLREPPPGWFRRSDGVIMVPCTYYGQPSYRQWGLAAPRGFTPLGVPVQPPPPPPNPNRRQRGRRSSDRWPRGNGSDGSAEPDGP